MEGDICNKLLSKNTFKLIMAKTQKLLNMCTFMHIEYCSIIRINLNSHTLYTIVLLK